MVMKMTRHAATDRLDRICAIRDNIGFGSIALQSPHDRDPNKRYCLTTTGILLVLNKTENILITAYLPTIVQLTAFYRSIGYASIPAPMYQMVIRNRNKFAHLL